MRRIGRALVRFIANEEGLETIEYAVIAGLIVLGVIAGVTAVLVALRLRFAEIADAIRDAQPPP